MSIFNGLPIFMIGFPSFKKISYDYGKVELEKVTHSLSDNPTDTTTRGQAEVAIYVSDNDALTISKAYVALDHPDKALQVTDKIVQSGVAGDSVVHFREALKKGDGGLEALKLPASAAARSVKMVTFDKNVITRKKLP